VVDIQASLALRLDGLKESVDALHQTQIEMAREMARYRGEKFQRLPVTQATGTNPFTMGGDVALALQAPEPGWIWSLRELTIEGLTSGATPDVINIRRGSAAGQIIWQLNGNQFCQSWGKGHKIIFAGETLFYQSVGTFNSTAVIKAYGTAQQVPSEMVGKLG